MAAAIVGVVTSLCISHIVSCKQKFSGGAIAARNMRCSAHKRA